MTIMFSSCSTHKYVCVYTQSAVTALAKLEFGIIQVIVLFLWQKYVALADIWEANVITNAKKMCRDLYSASRPVI